MKSIKLRAFLQLLSWLAVASLGTVPLALRAADQTGPGRLETTAYRLAVSPQDGSYSVTDKKTGVAWRSNPYRPRLGEVTVKVDGKSQRFDLSTCSLEAAKEGFVAVFRPLPGKPDASIRVRFTPGDHTNRLDCSYKSTPDLDLEGIRLLDDGLWVTDREGGYGLVPVRLGLLVPADSGLAFNQRFDTFAYEGCHMQMLGMVKGGSAMLVTWHDPYVTAEVRSVVTNAAWLEGKQALSFSLNLRKTANAFSLWFLGKGDHVTVAKAYRYFVPNTGWFVSWDDKLRQRPWLTNYFGASNFKLWSTLSRNMNDESTQEVSHRVNWTFDEAAQVAEHLKNDLQLDRILFIIGGWIHRGYDNQHPDILPAAPECGGDEALADCARRVRKLGYLFCLHDNYQDIYRDSPSWSEDWIMKTADGSLVKGGKWAGGRAYLTCSQKAVELARRKQNLPAVKKLTDANSYFIDTTYAAGLQECFDPKHPLTRWEDMKWKQTISDYARRTFGSFGSECGREWAIRHADFFEGLTGVSGGDFHNKDLAKSMGASVVPLFEIVFRDCIAMYGKYGYDFNRAADYVLHHVSIGRPLNYHSIPSHLYWKQAAGEEAELALEPAVAEVKTASPRRFEITYRWVVEKPPTDDWRIFVHFTDASGNIRFQNDQAPTPPVREWQAGEMRQGPFTVSVPEGLTGTFGIRMGMFKPVNGPRALLRGRDNGERSYLVGRLNVARDQVAFEPMASPATAPAAGEAGLFVRADRGWAQGMHPVDRFVKNTHEVLSPLNELTSRTPLTGHAFLTPDRKVEQTVFGESKTAVEVVVNRSATNWTHRSALGGSVVLPPFGFVVEGPTFAAFHARNWAGRDYASPPLFTLRSLDGKPLASSRSVRVFHAFGDPQIRLGKRELTVAREETITP